MRKLLVALLVASSSIALVGGCGDGEDDPSESAREGSVEITTTIDFVQEPPNGTFEITRGYFGCISGTFVDMPTEDEIEKSFTCEEGERVGTFTALIELPTEDGEVTPWRLIEGTGDFDAIEGDGEFSLEMGEDEKSGVETLTGNVRHKQTRLLRRLWSRVLREASMGTYVPDRPSRRSRPLPPSDRAPSTVDGRGRRSRASEPSARGRAATRPSLRGAASPKYEKAALRWLERYLTEGSPRLQHFAEITAGLAAEPEWSASGASRSPVRVVLRSRARPPQPESLRPGALGERLQAVSRTCPASPRRTRAHRLRLLRAGG